MSIVVPTFNRAPLLADLLDSLRAQDYPPERLEVIVVDDGSTDDTPSTVRAAQARTPVPIRYLHQERAGPAAARNRGVSESTGTIVGFTDSDCFVRPDWVRNAVRRMTDGVGLVSGPIRPVNRPGLRFFHHQIEEFRGENALYPTANAFYRRSAVEQVGGFDERFGKVFLCEDIDFAWRVKRAGYASAFADDAPVYHQASNVPALAWLIEPRRVYVMPRLVATYPELRRAYLWHRLFMSDAHAAFYLALAGAVVAARLRWPPGLLLVCPWLWRLRGVVRGDFWPPTRWWRIPIKYALMGQRFGLIAGILLWSSARHRTPVL